jgi:hypothetical protein
MFMLETFLDAYTVRYVRLWGRTYVAYRYNRVFGAHRSGFPFKFLTARIIILIMLVRI